MIYLKSKENMWKRIYDAKICNDR